MSYPEYDTRCQFINLLSRVVASIARRDEKVRTGEIQILIEPVSPTISIYQLASR